MTLLLLLNGYGVSGSGIGFDFTNPRLVFEDAHRSIFESEKSVILENNHRATFEQEHTTEIENDKQVRFT